LEIFGLAILGFRCASPQALCCQPLRGFRIFRPRLPGWSEAEPQALCCQPLRGFRIFRPRLPGWSVAEPQEQTVDKMFGVREAADSSSITNVDRDDSSAGRSVQTYRSSNSMPFAFRN
jgi:hypothetical protein